MKTDESALWFCAKIEAIRDEAGTTPPGSKRFPRTPALEREAVEKFPDDPFLYLHRQSALESETILEGALKRRSAESVVTEARVGLSPGFSCG